MFLNKILYFIAKHTMQLKNSINRKCKLFYLKNIYGNQMLMGNFRFRKGFLVSISESGMLKIGDNVFFNNNCSLTVHKKVVIGDNCMFGENVKIYDHNHRYEERNKLINEQGYSVAEVCIGEDCWIGSNVTILKGVHIGRHSVVGAGVIVYKDLPEYSVTICKQEINTKLME